MSEMIGYCGYRCDLCAARSADPVIRQKLVDGWRKIFGHQNYTAENVQCDGCKSDGKLADKTCQARPCASMRGLDSCAACDEFACDKVRHLIASRDGMLVFSKGALATLTKEEYNLCMRQFDSLPVLLAKQVEIGKAPNWVMEED
jgi:hypothetical protein